MTKKVFIALSLLFVFGLSGCGQKVTLDQYDIAGIVKIGYPSETADMVFEGQELIAEAEKLFSSMSKYILLSYVVDSAIYIEEELGEYDHLVMVNPRWMERFAEPDNLRPVEYDSLSESMRAFLEAQMPLLTVDGSILPDGIGLYEYDGGELFVLPQYAAEGYAEPLEAQNPLIILVDNPEETLKAKGCLLPLTSTGNLLFTDGEKLLELLTKSELNNYVQIHIIGEKR